MKDPGEVTDMVRRGEIQVKRSLVDKVVDAVSPSWGARRYIERIQQAQMERMAANFGYVGGRTDRKSMKEWQPYAGDANADINHQAPTLRARSRDLVRNSPVAAGAAATATTNVVGSGIRLSSEIDADYLGLSRDEAQAKQVELERLWRTVKDDLDFEGTEKQADLQALVYRTMFESGDVLVIRRNRMDPGNMIGLKVQLIEADRIRNPQFVNDNREIAGGVEVDGTGRVVAYHVIDRHPGNLFLERTWKWTRVPKHGRGGFALSRLVFSKTRPGQRRGVPYLAPVMEPLKQITRLTDYELMSSVVASMFTVFVKSENPATGQLPVSPVGFDGEAPDQGEIYMPGGGAVIDLKPGEDIITADPNRPNGAFAPFFDALVQQIGMALEIPFEVLMHRYQSSYSAARAAMLDAYRFFLHRRAFLADHFLSLQYEWVMLEAVALGIIDLPGFIDDPMARKAWLGSTWVGPAQLQINPQDDIKAASMRIDTGISNRKIETQALMGLDWDKDVQPQRILEKEQLEADGMSFASNPQVRAMDELSDDDDDRGEDGAPANRQENSQEEDAA